MESTDRISFEDFDQLDLKEFSSRLEAFFEVERDYIVGSLVVALSGGFGAGKTTFLKMWETSLLNRRSLGEFPPMPITLNAWESDHCGDPLLAILAGLLSVVDDWDGEDKPADKSKLKEAAKDVAWYSVALGNGIAAKFTGMDAFKAEEYVKKKSEARSSRHADYIQVFNDRMDALKGLKIRLAKSLGGQGVKVIIFVDELDRCRPDYAVSYLETIKHVFDVPGIVFVLAVDMPHLASSARTLFGNGLDFNEYFRKFCHRVFQLPTPSKESVSSLAKDYVSKYLEVEGARMSFLQIDSYMLDRVVDIARAFSLKPRQIQEAFRILGHTAQTLDVNRRGAILWTYGSIAILLSILRVGDSQLFFEILNSDRDIRKLCVILNERLDKRNAEWWILLVLANSVSEDQSDEAGIQIGKELGVIHSDTLDSPLPQFRAGWGGKSNKLKLVASHIEEAKSL